MSDTPDRSAAIDWSMVPKAGTYPLRRRAPEEVAPHVALNAMKAERARIMEIVRTIQALPISLELEITPFGVCEEILRRIEDEEANVVA